MYDFDRTFDRHNTEVIKWDRLEKDFGRKDLIPFGIADMDFETLPEITRAMTERAKHPTYGYTFPSEGYYESFIEWNRTRNHFDLKREELITIPGVVCACSFIIYALTEKGDKVMVNTPVYDPFFKVIEQQERTLVTSSLKLEHGRYEMDFEDMERKLAQNHIHAAVFCSPHNPCGRVWERDEIERAMDIYRQHDCVVISDEIWSDIILPGHKHIPTQSVSEDARMRTVALYAPSKTFNLAGLVGSYHIIYNETLRDRVCAVSNKTHYNEMNVLSMHALIGAYQPQGYEWLDELNEVIDANVDYFCNYVDEHFEGVSYSRPQGTYMVFLDCTEWCREHGRDIQWLLDEGARVGVGYQDGRPFHGPCHIRVNLALPLSRVKEACERLDRYVFGV